MATTYSVKFDIAPEAVEVPAGTMLTDAAEKAGIEINQPCGGQGRCGQCAVQVTSGNVRRRSTMRLSPEDVEQGYAIACQTLIEGDLTVVVPPQEKIQQRLTTGQSAADVSVPSGYDHLKDQTVQRIPMTLKATLYGRPNKRLGPFKDCSATRYRAGRDSGLSACFTKTLRPFCVMGTGKYPLSCMLKEE